MSSVRDFGARGDGLTDDSAAIQAALDLGGDVYVPPGVYRILRSLVITRDGTNFHGAGRRTVLQLTADARDTMLYVPERWEGQIDPANVPRDVVVADMTLDGNYNPIHETGQPDYFGVFIRQAERITLRNLVVRGWPSDGITVSNGAVACRDVTVEDCIIHDCCRNGLHLGAVKGCVVRDCHIYNVPSQHNGPSAANAIDIEVEGVEAIVADVLIEGCTLERRGTQTAGYGIQIAPAYGPVRGVTVRNNTILNHQMGVSIMYAPPVDGVLSNRDLVIEGNTLIDYDSHVTSYSVMVFGGTNVRITGNFLHSNVAYANFLVRDSVGVLIADNDIRSELMVLRVQLNSRVVVGGNRWTAPAFVEAEADCTVEYNTNLPKP